LDAQDLFSLDSYSLVAMDDTKERATFVFDKNARVTPYQ
jgi:hypothetical protein